MIKNTQPRRRLKRSVRKAIEIAAVVIVTAAAFAVCRKLGVQERGNTLWGGEVLIPVMLPAIYAGVKSMIRDIRGGTV